MLESGLTPPHTDSLEALLNQPFTGALNHPRAQRYLLTLKVLIADVRMMTLKIGLNLKQCGQILACEELGIHQGGQHGQDRLVLTMT